MDIVNIEYVTHASLLLDNGETRLLLDPFYFLDGFMGSFMCHFPPRDLTTQSLGHIDYVFSSHIHPDHCHKNTLAQIRNQVTSVLLPAERRALVDLYAGLGFGPPRLLERETMTKLSDRLNVTVYWDGSVDTAAVIEMDGCTVLHQNDCRLSPRTLELIASRHRIDFAFLLYTSCQSLFPFILDRPMDELERLAEERERGLLNYQVSCVELLRPKAVVPYSMTMTFTQKDTMYVNSLWRFTPSTFCEALQQRCGELECLVMHPGDRIEWSPQAHQLIQGTRARDYWGHSKDEYVQNVSEFLAVNRGRLPEFDLGSTGRVMERLVEQVTQRMLREPPESVRGESVLISVFDRESRELVYVDFAARRALRAAAVEGTALLTIDVPASVVESLLDGLVDPFVALYTHRVRFSLHSRRELQPELEGMIYLETMFHFFAKGPTREMAETDGMKLARKGSPHLSSTWTTVT